ncbi:low affinity iron permease family protein [Pusillimonas sp.]|uniref:low affinity iron permease family protein n=1 Tax=Pusillimonas sp. TaxID=3040095 RepID=UPI0029AB768A|nr:low affinity iron permease family protein [Pusillimonas sp.]MDX3894675.1 low affinity iron permease family protein [Pusillimonas sp.]
MEDKFRYLSERIAQWAGTPWSFSIAIGLVLLWAVSGPVFGYSDTWQLVINTGTTIITFLMVFLIQNTQNRDAIAVQLKLDELLRVVKGARTGMINVDQLSNAELQELRRHLEEIGRDEGCDLASIEAKVTSRSRRRHEKSGALSEETQSERSVEVEIEKKAKDGEGSKPT